MREAVEVGPAVTAYTAVEIGLFVTVAGVMSQLPSRDHFHLASIGDRRAAVSSRPCRKSFSLAPTCHSTPISLSAGDLWPV